MGHFYRFKRGDRVTDYPDEYAPGYHIVLDSGPVVTVRWDEVAL